MRLACLAGVLTGLALVACDQPSAPGSAADPRLQRTAHADDDDESGVEGKGEYSINGLIVTFSVDAEAKKKDLKARGEFTIYADEGDGLIVDFKGKVTCLSFDPVNHRAWIGGKVKKNRSTDPTLQTAIHQKGRDIWFRVLDEPAGDRSTFVGFEGAAGFITSADYCAGQPWPAENARTWPVVSGRISVRP